MCHEVRRNQALRVKFIHVLNQFLVVILCRTIAPFILLEIIIVAAVGIKRRCHIDQWTQTVENGNREAVRVQFL